MIRYLFFSSDGKKLFLAQKNSISVWDADTCNSILSCYGSLIGISLNEQICLTYSKEKSVVAWDLAVGGVMDFNELAYQDFPYHQRVILSHDNCCTLLVQDIFFPEQSPKRIPLHEQLYYRAPILKIPQSGYVLVNTWWDAGFVEGSTLLCYDVETGTIVLSKNGGYENAPVFSPEHGLLIVGDNIFDTFSGEKIKTVKHSSPIRSVSLDPKNLSRLAIAVRRRLELVELGIRPDKTVPLLERNSIQTEKIIRESAVITDVAFHPDGKRVACILINGSLHIWDITTNQIISENQI
jgi:WD40 repeat protein